MTSTEEKVADAIVVIQERAKHAKNLGEIILRRHQIGHCFDLNWLRLATMSEKEAAFLAQVFGQIAEWYRLSDDDDMRF